MPHLETLFTLTLMGITLPVSGYALGIASLKKTAGDRFAIGILMGLGVLIWSLSLVNLIMPITTTAALLCLWPIPLCLLRKSSRDTLLLDAGIILKDRRGQLGIGLTALLSLLLLGPLLIDSSMIFFDGTGNHDSYFWVTGGEFLRQHSYLETPAANSLHPAFNSVGSITGMYPLWGRMGGEGLVAFCAALAQVPSERIYLAMSTALLVPWLAICYLLLRRFFMERLNTFAIASMVLLQPIYLFAHLNANLPNLLGALFGATAVLATEYLMDEQERRVGLLVLLGLSVHGLLCCYPEMVPFVIAPAGLLWLRRTPDWVKGRQSYWHAIWPLLGWCTGALLNLATTQRAWFGFLTSFYTGRANQNWGNMFATLNKAEMIPGLLTLAPNAAELLGWTCGLLASLGLVAGLIAAGLRARDKMGALILCAGGGILLAYTICTGFHYGWQKAMQFTGVIAGAWTVAALCALASAGKARGAVRIANLCMVPLLLLFLIFATGYSIAHAWWKSERKRLTQDWSELQSRVSRVGLKGAILVDSGTFPMAFFHGMWAPYFLPKNTIVYAERDPNAGGYQRFHSLRESMGSAPKTEAILVDHQWADCIDHNSPRVIETNSYTLLRTMNRVTQLEGFYPPFGIPERMGPSGHFSIIPHSDSTIAFDIAPGHARTRALVDQTLRVVIKTEGLPVKELSFTKPETWHLKIPLKAGRLTEIKLSFSLPVPDAAGLFPYETEGFRIENLKPADQP